MIRNANNLDLEQIHNIEKNIEGNNAATIDTIQARLDMFQQGFLIYEKAGVIRGYIQSCIWNKEDFKSFNHVSNFPLLHNINGNNLYIIFLATAEKHRKQGIGSNLIKELQNYAKSKNLKKVQLVSKKSLVKFYSNLGFGNIEHMSNSLSDPDYTLMEYIVS